MIAVAGGEQDGTSGLRDENSSQNALRSEIESLARIIFSSNQKQIDFWLGRGAAKPEELEKKWGGRKPCLHGSDAHDLATVGMPANNRFCWLKGDLTFESLKQVCIEPEGRVHIGLAPPRGGLPAQTISKLIVANSPWLKTQPMHLNAGLVAVIGARGSGKTALADLIAAGGYSLYPHLNERSFIRRAEDLLDEESTAELTWETGEQTSNNLKAIGVEELLDVPRVQYLSQQFVDQLCSAEGINDALMTEIERVIFQSHRIEDRSGTTQFQELLALKTELSRTNRERQQVALAKVSEELFLERARKSNKNSLLKQQEQFIADIKKDKADRQTLIGKDQEARTQQFEKASADVESCRIRVEKAKRRVQQLKSLQALVVDIRDRQIGNWLEELMDGREEVGFSTTTWESFRLQFSGDVIGTVEAALRDAQTAVSALVGPAPGEIDIDPEAPPSPISYIAAGTDASTQTLSLLEKERSRLVRLVGIDATNAKKLSALSEKITKQETSLERVGKDIQLAERADSRITELRAQRSDIYQEIFKTLGEEEEELRQLYAPLESHLNEQSAALRKLSFTVKRTVDISGWAEQGEALLDLRVTGPLKGRGALLSAAKATLMKAWAEGTPLDVGDAMSTFRDKYEQALADHALVPKTDKEAYREWAKQLADWLYSTSHITISYGVNYDGVAIEQLSPGTRGIVLLLLYLAVDNEDDRPLIIDQPEENLDPQSIFQELVQLFRDAKLRRQIIIVTHNANLVVNTDADQVIVASCGPHRAGYLPEITYESGGLENPLIRTHVCNILEGGESAFRERAKRLRVKLN